MNDSKEKREPTPSEKAWETAREQAREQGRSVRDDEIRCIKTKGLSVYAKILFWILSKICWENSGFLHERRVGSVCITGRQLKTHFDFPEKRLYAQTKKVKDKSGAVVATRRSPGAAEELERAGLVWKSKKRIENIPSNKWPTVFNLVRLVPRREQQSLGLLEDVVIVGEECATDGGSSDFPARNGGGGGQPPQKEPANPQTRELATTNGGSGQPPLAGVGSNQRGELAATTPGSSATTNGGGGQPPLAGVGSDQWWERATTAGGIPIRLSDVRTVPLDSPDFTLKRSTAANAIDRGGKPGKNGSEKIFLLDVACMMDLWRKGTSKAELEQSGGWWRMGYRGSPEVMRRVVAEITVLIKEGRIKETPGAAAVDLFERWGGKCAKSPALPNRRALQPA